MVLFITIGREFPRLLKRLGCLAEKLDQRCGLVSRPMPADT